MVHWRGCAIASICTRQEPLLHMFDYVKEGERVEDGMSVTSRGVFKKWVPRERMHFSDCSPSQHFRKNRERERERHTIFNCVILFYLCQSADILLLHNGIQCLLCCGGPRNARGTYHGFFWSHERLFNQIHLCGKRSGNRVKEEKQKETKQ